MMNNRKLFAAVVCIWIEGFSFLAGVELSHDSSLLMVFDLVVAFISVAVLVGDA